jgi:hypothetical protein
VTPAYSVSFSSWSDPIVLPCSSLSLQFNIINKALLQGDHKEGVGSKTKNLASGLLHAAKSAEAYRSIAERVSIRIYAFLHSQRRSLLRRRMKWESEKVLSMRIGDDKKEWILSKNLKGLIGLE